MISVSIQALVLDLLMVVFSMLDLSEINRLPFWSSSKITITETWLRPEDTESFISSITPPGYKFTHVPRNVKKGGGVGFFIKEDLSFERVSKNSYQAFESISIQISTEGAKDGIFHVVYRPPNLSKSQFLDEFGMFLEGAALSGYENILLGDLNFHLDKHDTWTLKFMISLSNSVLHNLSIHPHIFMVIFWMLYV